ALDLHRLRDLRVGVDVDLGQHEPTGILVGQLLEDRAELLAGLAPVRPEVDDDGYVERALGDVLLERLVGDVDRIQAALPTRGASRAASGRTRVVLRRGQLGQVDGTRTREALGGHGVPV